MATINRHMLMTLGCLDHVEYRLFTGLVILADPKGKVFANPLYLRGQIFWGYGCDLELDIDAALDALCKRGLVSIEEDILAITDWDHVSYGGR